MRCEKTLVLPWEFCIFGYHLYKNLRATKQKSHNFDPHHCSIEKIEGKLSIILIFCTTPYDMDRQIVSTPYHSTILSLTKLPSRFGLRGKGLDGCCIFSELSLQPVRGWFCQGLDHKDVLSMSFEIAPRGDGTRIMKI